MFQFHLRQFYNPVAVKVHEMRIQLLREPGDLGDDACANNQETGERCDILAGL